MMEERYTDDTVELIDYLRVMWWGKWIIFGCLVVAIGLSILSVSLKPTTYSGALEFSFREYVTSTLRACDNARTLEASEMGSFLVLVQSAIPGVTATPAGNRITLSLGNGLSADSVSEALVRAAADLEQQITLIIADELACIERTARIRESSLSMQLDILEQQLADERDTQESVMLTALSGEIVDLRAQIAQQETLLDTLGTTAPDDFFTLSSVGDLAITSSDPSGRTTIAIAAFLGLMIGVLLAFFVHYLVQIRERERHPAKGE